MSMKHILSILIFALLLFTFSVKAQVTAIDSVIVEKYYISDTNDATDTIYIYNVSTGTDTTGMYTLKTGSTTYRIYIDLKQGYKLTKIYGDVNHALKIMSDSVFFNHIQGASVGSSINKNTKYKNFPTSALDTWLTLGMATTRFPGILKSDDTTPSIVGGPFYSLGNGNNSSGFLNSTNAAAGIPLTVKDGLAASVSPITLNPSGDLITADSTTIFGTKIIGSQFISNNASLQYASGVQGTTPDNRILVAQLTTKGKISFELNMEVVDTTTGKKINYIATGNNSITAAHDHDTLSNTSLTYPPPCGCRDPNYLEYNARYACDDDASCKTLIVFGCMDPLACNYDPKANYNLQNLCCYPGYCNNRDINLVCPGISNSADFSLYPNPAKDQLTLQFTTGGDNEEINYSIYDSFGVLMLQKNMGMFSAAITQQVDISNLKIGLYMIRVSIGDTSESKLFMKN